MTSSSELIAEARRAVAATGYRQSTILIAQMADALEAAEAERAEFKRELESRELHHFEVEEENARLHGIIERAKAVTPRIPEFTPSRAWPKYQDDVRRFLSEADTAPRVAPEVIAEAVERNAAALEALAENDGPVDTVPREGEWEYGLVNPDALPGQYGRDDRAHLVSRSREHIERQQRRGHPSIRVVRRRPAGPWLPVDGGSHE